MMIKITNLTKKYDNYTAVNDLNLEIKDGSIFGFLGSNGAGKTTTIKMLTGITEPTDGTIEIEGKPLDKNIIGYMPEDPYFYDHLTATEFLKFMGGLCSNNTTTEQCNDLLKKVGLADVADKKVENFSKGMKQRLGLAQALINNPKYIFLDEPLDGLDPIGRLEFKDIILNLKKEKKTVFFNSHILSDVEEICDQIGVIEQGKLIYSGSVKSFCGKATLEKKFVEVIRSNNAKNS